MNGPREGWLTLLLVALLAVSVAWSLDDAGLVLGQGTWTDFLAWAALGGVLMGFLGARAGWNRPMAHTIAAVAAGLIVPLMVGSVLLPHASWSAAFHATADSVTDAVIDFAVLGLPVTRQSGHYLLVLGLLCWANGQFAASAVFRTGRPIGPIVVLGAVLVANMSATQHDQIWFIVLFSLAALFLLIRLHALEERTTWIRRRIGDPAVVGSLYLRGGTRVRGDRGVPGVRSDCHGPLGAARGLLGRREAGPGRHQPVAAAADSGRPRQPDARRAVLRGPGHDRRPVDDLQRPGARDRPGRRRTSAISTGGRRPTTPSP